MTQKIEGKSDGIAIITNIAIGAQTENLGVAVAVLAALKDEPVARAKVLAALAKFSLAPPTLEGDAEVPSIRG